jgi:beta-N-acetylhexosaminidase
MSRCVRLISNLQSLIPNLQSLIPLLLVLCLIAPHAAHAQNPLPFEQYTQAAQNIARHMNVNEKIGQLFVVNIPGHVITDTSPIADLIANERIGGVYISAANGNYTQSVLLPTQVATLTNQLQALAALTGTNNATQTYGSGFVPLFIVASADAPGALHNESSQGLTQIPAQLALGATWKPENAATAGRIVGEELAQIGVNVLLGPTLDVLDMPKPGLPGDAGTRVFGGDPFWVGKFGAAFVQGVHGGSDSRVAVIAKNFPGLGSSDRNIEDEIPTVQKSLEQLKQIELAPFFAVTQQSPYDQASAEGLLVSHIRYRGFQGNIRASTRPVSLDPQAYQALMSLPPLDGWRRGGGVTFSDSLGTRSLRRFYDPLEKSFNARRIAQEAFVAGNDVLLLGNFGLTNNWAEQLANIKDTLEFFRTKYAEDQTFANRVDEALLRILSLKLRLYGGSFTLQNAWVNLDAAAQMRPNTEDIAAIAKESITLLSPSARDYPAVISSPPNKDDNIVFITDDRLIQECETCTPYPAIGPTALQDIALELYGPKTTGQLDPQRMSSFTFHQLAAFGEVVTPTQDAVTPVPGEVAAATITPTLTLEIIPLTLTVTQAPITPTLTPTLPAELPANTLTPAPALNPAQLQTDISKASWIVIGMLDLNPGLSSTAVLRDFLSQQADALRDKKVIILAFSAPYYLDATEVSKATAYFGVYSRSSAYLRAAIRALFGSVAVTGASPVSADAVGYSVVQQTEPNPEQLIPMQVGEAVTGTTESASPLQLDPGEPLKLRAGPIFDRNNNVVPDNTPVQFVVSFPTERVQQNQIAFTTNGSAETTVVIERTGTVEIRAESEPALRSYVIRVNLSDKNEVLIETIKPTAIPTNTPVPTVAPTITAPPAPTVAPPPAPPAQRTNRTNWPAFAITLVLLLGVGLIGLTAATNMSLAAKWRAALISITIGWVAYVLYALGSPGTRQLEVALGWVGLPIIAAVCAALALAVFLVGAQRSTRQ